MAYPLPFLWVDSPPLTALPRPSPPPFHPQNARELSVLGVGAFLEEGSQEDGGGGAKPVNFFQLYHHSLDMYSDLNKINKCIFIAAQNFRFTMHE